MKMKKLIVSLAVLGLLFGLVGTAIAGDSDSHSVTVTVSAINEIDVYEGEAPSPEIELTIFTATAGSEPDPVENTDCTLLWTTNAANKITVQTDLTYTAVTLTVEAIGNTAGTAAGVITLGTAASDFITGVGKTKGSCTLKYIASATVEVDLGSYDHTITYTLTTP